MSYRFPVLFILLFSFIGSHSLYAQNPNDSLSKSKDSLFLPADTVIISQDDWVDSLMKNMSMDEKIGQLFMIRAHSNKSNAYHEKVRQQIKDYKVGGLCFFQGGPERQKALIHSYRKDTKIPLFVAIDGEWGIGMRLDSVPDFPRQMTLGATNDTALLYAIGQALARQCKEVGLNINFAPVADVNNNPMNPVINSRSFGENPKRVAQYAWQIAKGMQDEHVMACAKHFPGHGDTYSDSHLTLPTIKESYNNLDSIHFSTFRYLAKKGVQSVMTAHLFIPALDTTPNQASSLSPRVIQGLLFDSLKFQGLAFTDALEMKGVSQYFEAGEIELKALMAGNDILLLPPDMAKAVEQIKQAVKEGKVSEETLNQKVRKILIAKYKLGLAQEKEINTKPSNSYLNSNYFKALINQAYKKAITAIVNDSTLPLAYQSKQSIAIVSIGENAKNEFSNQVLKYHKAQLFSLPSKASLSQAKVLAKKLENFDKVIIHVMNTRNSARSNYGISQTTIDFTNLVCQKKDVIVILAANPYAAGRFVEQCEPKALLITYQDNELTRRFAADALFGAEAITGTLPVSIDSKYKEGFGLKLKKNLLNEVYPEELGISNDQLERIDSIIEDGMKQKAYPGAQVLIAKDGHIFYHKNFGYQSYKHEKAITRETIYDLASITKVMASTLALMRLVDEGKVDVDMRLVDYLPELKGSNKQNIYLRDLLAHQARLQPWLPFYLDICPEGQADSLALRTKAEKGYMKQVSQHLFILDSYRDTMLQKITDSELRPQKKYKYSDLGLYYIQEIIERKTGMSLDAYCDSIFYHPLGLEHTLFNPLNKYPADQMAPTEKDSYFRHELIQGFVHDQGAAMLGGVGGHAGLFSNTSDMVIIAQMLLQNGQYANHQYLKPATLEDFTRQQFPLNHNRRGLGFDKPLPQRQDGGPTSTRVSGKSFGHSGFTGTYFWVDPKYNLIYIFLSNRVNPSAENRKLIEMGIRTKIQDEIYKIIQE